MEVAPLLIAIVAGIGVHLLYSAITDRRNGSRPSDHSRSIGELRSRLQDWLTQAGIAPAQQRNAGAGVLASLALGMVGGWVLFGGFLAPLLTGAFTATFPVASYKQRRNKRRSEAADAWPRMIEEIRLLCGSLGRPIPQALLEVGKRGPIEMRSAFLQAEREWLISTDFARTTSVLKDNLADPTADTVCETLLLAHNIGGNDVERRLGALAQDRQMDLHARKDARAKQSGVTFARRFVLIVPFGMALAGLSIGDGRAAYGTVTGQIGVASGLATLSICWWWAGRLIRLPESRRVFRA